MERNKTLMESENTASKGNAVVGGQTPLTGLISLKHIAFRDMEERFGQALCTKVRY
jgi:hypothetical protein